MTEAAEAQTEAQAPEVYPIEMSGHGTNTHYIHCVSVGWAQNYAVCQHIIKNVEANTIGKNMPECQRAICGGSCPAKKMMAEEQEAGHALYFKPRQYHWEDPSQAATEQKERINYDSDSYKRGRHGLSAVTKPVAKPKPKGKLANISNNLDAAAVVNEMAKEAAETGKPVVTATQAPPTELPPRDKGESPVAYQRRLKELGLV